jgi:hypothetical protein
VGTHGSCFVCVAKLLGLRETVVYNRQVIFEC